MRTKFVADPGSFCTTTTWSFSNCAVCMALNDSENAVTWHAVRSWALELTGRTRAYHDCCQAYCVAHRKHDVVHAVAHGVRAERAYRRPYAARSA